MNTSLLPLLAAWLVTYAVHSTILLGAAALLTPYLRRESWKETLWKAALLGSLLTPCLQLATRFEPLGGRHALGATAPSTVVYTATPGPADPVAPLTPLAAGSVDPSKATADAPARSASAATTSGSLILWWGFGLWALGAAVLLLRFTLRQRGLVRALRSGERPASPETLRMLEGLQAASGVRRHIRLAASEACVSPLVLPGAHIFVPTSFSTDFEEGEQRAALAHELAHVARRDPEWMLAAALIGCVGWIQPLNLLARRGLRESAEYMSDAWAVQHTGSAGGLASGLAKVASWVLHSARPIPAGTSAMTEGGSLLVRRVERLLRERAIEVPVRIGLRLTAAALVCSVAVGAAPRIGWTGEAAPPALFTGTPDVIRHPDPSQPLAQRWGWAAREAATRRLRGYWVAYGIERTPRHPGEAIISDSRGFDLGTLTDGSAPLGRALLGEAQAARFPARTAVLFHVPAGGRIGAFDGIAIRTLSINFDARRDPILWLGLASDAESVPYLDALTATRLAPELQREVVGAIAFHATSSLVLPVLDRFLRSSPNADLRAQAAEGLAYHDHPEALALLNRTIAGDAEAHVRMEAVEALGEIRVAGAFEQLVALAREAPLDVRREAIESLAEQRKGDALGALNGLIASEQTGEVLNEAVESLGDLPDGAGTPTLVRLSASDPRPEVRSKALEMLGDALRDSPSASREQAFAALERAAAHRDPDTRRAAVEALGEGRDARSRMLLRRLMRTDPDERVREEARDALDQ